MKNIKRRIEFFSLYDHTNIEKHLEKMASKGWMIEIIGSTFWRYKRIEPQKLKFSVVYYPKDVNEGTVISADRQNFIDMCTSGGWNYVVNSGRMHVFCTENEYTPPIETDAEIQIECIHKFAKSEIILNYTILTAVCILLILFFAIMSNKTPVDALLDESYKVWFTPVFIFFSLYNIIRYMLWYKKARNNAEQGEFTKTIRLIKIEALYWIPIHAVSAGLELFTMIRLRYTIFTIGLIITAIIFLKIHSIISAIISKKDTKKSTMKALKASSAVVLTALYVAASFGIYATIPKPYKEIPVKTSEGVEIYQVYNDKNAPLDIAEYINTDKEISREKNYNFAFLIKQEEWTMKTVEENSISLEYTITDINFTPIFEKCKKELIFDSFSFNYNLATDPFRVKNYAGYETYRFNGSDENKPENIFAFCDNKRIVLINFDFEPNDEQITTAAEKLMNAEI